jgi:hypothetical protein
LPAVTTVEAIGRELVAIASEAVHGDHALAHKHEREMHQAVLAAIAGGLPNARELAQAALKSAGLEIDRSY